MRVSAVRRRPRRADAGGPDDVSGVDALRELLPRADALVAALPLTDETKGMIAEAELALLPRHAVVVNVARGRIFDEEALYRALRDRTIGAAGIDVWYRYPRSDDERSRTAPSTLPFRDLDNVVMSPHRAGTFGSEDVERRRMEELAVSLNAAAAGEAIPSAVDVRLGY